MWLIEKKTFLTNQDQISQAATELQQWLAAGKLTIILGNGPTRSATYLNALTDRKSKNIGWENAVKVTAQKSGINKKFYSSDQNLLAVAQAVFEKVGIKRARELLIEELGEALLKTIKTTLIHHITADLNPRAIVTTNYDLQIERAYAEMKRAWIAVVRNVSSLPVTSGTPIFKMHGTLSPDIDYKSNYIYPNPDFERQPENSIIISESDYDECLKELKDIPKSPLLSALENPCLIIGKSFTWQDLSFLYALRATREKRSKRAYMITPSLTLDEELNLGNLGIQPLVINMPVPRMREDGHFYVGFVKALLELFPKYREIYNQQIVDFAYEQNLIRAPHFVTLGLAAHNTLGRMQYFGDIGDRKNPKYILPSEGRRNLRLEAKDYAGGAALTALGVFASLDWEHKYQPSIISTVGNDIYKQVVLDFCKQFRIDVDGLSETASNTWQSTVLIHESHTHDKKIYPGQRIFLDRGFEKPLFLSKGAEEQFEAQLDHTQPNLRLVYFDKFLALPYPFNPDEMDREGLLMKNEHLLEEIINDRKDVDVLYETGGGGSQRLIVEKRLGKYINIFTAGFPFFVRNILSDNNRMAHRGLERFSQDDWFQAEFGEETLAIESIFDILNLTPFEERTNWFIPPSDWIVAGKERVGRKHHRRWLVVTLHHYGALAIDLNAEKAWYCSIPFDAERTQNTAGAGDVFRGAFCYALLRFGENSQEDYAFEETLLLNCTKFANKIAFEKCAIYDMNDAYQMMGSFSKKYLPS